MLAGLPLFRECAALAKLLGKLGRCVGCGLRLVELGHRFPGGNRIDPGAPRVGGELQGAQCRVQLCLPETGVGDCDVPFSRGERQDVVGDHAFDRLECFEARRADPGQADRDRRIDEHRRLPGIGSGIPQVGVGGLQPPVVEECHLNRRLDIDRFLSHQRLHAVGYDTCVLLVLYPDRLLSYGLGSLGLDRGEPGVLRCIFARGHAAAEHKWQGEGRSPFDIGSHHDASPSGVCASFRLRHGWGSTGTRWVYPETGLAYLRGRT